MDFQDPPVDFTGLATSLGVKGERVEDPSELRQSLEAAFEYREGPKLIEVICDGSL